MIIVKRLSKDMPEFLGLQGTIDRIYTAIDCNWTGVMFPDDKKPGKKKVSEPAPKKPKKPLSEMTKAEQADAREAEREVKLVTDYLEYFHVEADPDAIDAGLQPGRDYLESIYKKVDEARKKQKLGPYDTDYARIWSEHLPALRDIVKAYIEDLSKWMKDPPPAFFQWNHKSFVQFRQKMQRQY